MSKKEGWRGEGWSDPPPSSVPIDHVPVLNRGKMAHTRRWLRRAFNAAAIAAATVAAFCWSLS